MDNKQQIKRIRELAKVIAQYASVTDNLFLKCRADEIIFLTKKQKKKCHTCGLPNKSDGEYCTEDCERNKND